MSTGSDREQWSWRIEKGQDNRRLGLLYEPGNWGDVLKGIWATLVTQSLIESDSLERSEAVAVFRYLDPFAGRATYPLIPSTKSRLRWLGAGDFVRAQKCWLERGELASTGLLVKQAATRSGVDATLEVFDIDPERLQSWQAVAKTHLLDIKSGEEALEDVEADLVLIDPYDLFDRWKSLLAAIVDAAQQAWVLLYLHNRSPRGGGHVRNYSAFRAELGRLAGRQILVGRIPSDVVLPRAFHEVVLLGPDEPDAQLARQLLRATKGLACKMSTSGAFERGKESP